MPIPDPISTTEVVTSPDYLNASYEDRSTMLRGLHESNLQYIKGVTDQSEDPLKHKLYAEQLQSYNGRMRTLEQDSLAKGYSDRVAAYADTHNITTDSVLDLFDKKSEAPLPPELAEIDDWHIGENKRIEEKRKTFFDVPNVNQVITNQQGVAYAESNVGTDLDGKNYGVVTPWRDESGQESNVKHAIRVELNGDVEGKIASLDKELKEKRAQQKQMEEGSNSASKYNSLFVALGMAGGGGYAGSPPSVEAGKKAEEYKAEADKIEDKIKSFSDGREGKVNFLQDQLRERMQADEGLRKYLPTGSNVLSKLAYDAMFTVADTAVGARQGVNAAAGDTEEARSLGQTRNDIRQAQSISGFGHARNPNSMIEHAANLVLDEAPQTAMELAIGAGVSSVMRKGMTMGFGKVVEEGVEQAVTKAARTAELAQRFGPKVGAAVGTAPTAVADAASNMNRVYGRVDSLLAEAHLTKDGPEKQALLAKAQNLEDSQAGIFFAHLAATQALEYLPMEQLLRRVQGDVPLSTKVFRGLSGEVGEAATQKATAKNNAFKEAVGKFLASKYGAKTLGAIENGSTEGITEGLQQLADNKIAQEFYDENQELLAGVPESVLGGMFLGAGFGFLAQKAPGGTARAVVNNIADTEKTAQDEAQKQRDIVRMASGNAKGEPKPETAENVVFPTAEGKWEVKDQDLPKDAPPSPQFDTPEAAEAYASNRWENYHDTKIREVFSNTEKEDGSKWTTEQIDGMITVQKTMLSKAAKAQGVPAESIYKAFSNSIQFYEGPEEFAAVNAAMMDPTRDPENTTRNGVNGREHVAPAAPSKGSEVGIVRDIIGMAKINPKFGASDLGQAALNYERDLSIYNNLSTEEQSKVNPPEAHPVLAVIIETEKQKANERARTQQGTTGATETSSNQAGTQAAAGSGVQQDGSQQDSESGETLNQDAVVREPLGDSVAEAFPSGLRDFVVDGTKYIGAGKVGSRSENARIAAGNKANTGEYGARDHVVVSSEEDAPPNFDEIKKATDAGATIRTVDRFSGAIENQLVGSGYVQVQPRVWRPKNAQEIPKLTPRAKAPKQASPAPVGETTKSAPPTPAPGGTAINKRGYKAETAKKIKNIDKSILDAMKEADEAANNEESTTPPELQPLSDISDVNTWVNKDGSIRVDMLLNSIPKNSPLYDLAQMLNKVLPEVIGRSEMMNFKVSTDKNSAGIEKQSDSKVIVGSGILKFDTIGQRTTVAELMNHVTNYVMQDLIGLQLDMVQKSIKKRPAMNASGFFKKQLESPSAVAIRAAFELAMPAAQMGDNEKMTVRTDETMKRRLTTAELARIFTYVNPNTGSEVSFIPADRDYLNALASMEEDGEYSPMKLGTENPNDAQIKGKYYTQSRADGTIVPWRFGQKRQKWEQIPHGMGSQHMNGGWRARPEMKFDYGTGLNRVASIYMRAVMRGGHFNALFGNKIPASPEQLAEFYADPQNEGKKPEADFVSGMAGIGLTREEYDRNARENDDPNVVFPPYEMTSLPRFVAAVLSDPAFARDQSKQKGWYAARDDLRNNDDLKKDVYDAVIGDMLGASRVFTNSKKDGMVAALMMGPYIEKRRKVLTGHTVPPHRKPAPQDPDKPTANAHGQLPVDFRSEDQPDPENPQSEYSIPLTTKAEIKGDWDEAVGRKFQKEVTPERNFSDTEAEEFDALDAEDQQIKEGERLEAYYTAMASIYGENAVRVSRKSAKKMEAAEAVKKEAQDLDQSVLTAMQNIGVDAMIMETSPVTEKTIKGQTAEFKESPLTALKRATILTDADLNPLIPVKHFSALLSELRGIVPQKDLNELALTYHNAHKPDADNKFFKALREAQTVFASQNGFENYLDLPREKKNEFRPQATALKKFYQDLVTPWRVEPGTTAPSFEFQVSDSEEEGAEFTAPPPLHGAPVLAVASNKVASAFSSGHSTQELRAYVGGFDPQHLANVHDALSIFADSMGIPLKNIYDNSEGKQRIKRDSLEDWGNLEVALDGARTTVTGSDPAISSYAADNSESKTTKKADTGTRPQFDATMLRDMHALASSFVDTIAYNLKEDGKRVAMRAEFVDRLAKPEGAVGKGFLKTVEKATGETVGEPSTPEGEDEDKGPYVVADVDILNSDPVNENKVYKEGSSRQFQMRGPRFSFEGKGYDVKYTHGLQPFIFDENGREVAVTEETQFASLNGMSVKDAFESAADMMRKNSIAADLEKLYVNLWKRAFSGPEGTKALAAMRERIEGAREYHTDLPVISFVSSPSRSMLMAQAVAEAINQQTGREGILNQDEQDQNRRSKKDFKVMVANGQFHPTTKLVAIFKKGDPSTLIHETVHWMRFMKDKNGVSLLEHAMGTHYKAFMEWATENGKLDPNDKKQARMIEERIARGAEEFLRSTKKADTSSDDGVRNVFLDKLAATNKDLVPAFSKFIDLMTDIYRGMRSLVPLDKRAYQAYDALFGVDDNARYSKKNEYMKREAVKLKSDERRAQLLGTKKETEVVVRQDIDELLAQEALALEENPDRSYMPLPSVSHDPISYDDPVTEVFSQHKVVPLKPDKKSAMRVNIRKGVNYLARWFAAHEGMRWAISHAMHFTPKGQKDSIARKAEKNSGLLMKAINAHLGGTLGVKRSLGRENLMRDVNSYLRARNDADAQAALTKLPTKEIIHAARDMRAHINKFTNYLISANIAQGGLHAAIHPDKGYFLHLSYDLAKNSARADSIMNGGFGGLYHEAFQIIQTNTGKSDDEVNEIINELLTYPNVARDEASGNSIESSKNVSLRNLNQALLDEGTDKIEQARDLLWGVIEDPIFNYVETMNHLGNVVSVNSGVEELLLANQKEPFMKADTDAGELGDPMNTYIFNPNEAVNWSNNPAKANAQVLLHGMKTTPEIANYIRGVVNGEKEISNAMLRGTLKGIATVNGFTKSMQTVFNFFSLLRNAYSAYITCFGQGHLNPLNYWKAAALLSKEGLGINMSPEDEKLIQEAVSQGVASSTQIDELRDLMRHGFAYDKKSTAVGGGKHTGNTTRLASEVSRGLMLVPRAAFKTIFGLYNGVDTYVKLVSYLHEKDNVKAMYPKMTPKEVQFEAARRTHATMFSFDQLPKFVNNFRRYIPLLGPYTSFGWEMTRTGINSIKQGANDVLRGKDRVQNGEEGGGKQVALGLLRLTAMTTASLGLPALARQMFGVFGWDDEAQKKVKSLVSDWYKDDTLIPITPPGQNMSFVNMSNILPYDALVRATTELLSARDLSIETMGKIAKPIAEPFIKEAYISDAYSVLVTGKNVNGETFITPDMEKGEWLRAYISALVSPAVPGTIRSGLALADPPESLKGGTVDKWLGSLATALNVKRKNMTGVERNLTFAGASVVKVNVPQVLRHKTSDMIDKMHASTNAFVQLATSPNPCTKEQFTQTFAHALGTIDKVTKEGNALYATAINHFGLDSGDAEDILKGATSNLGKLQEHQRENILDFPDEPPVIKVSERRLEDMKDASNKYQAERVVWIEELEDSYRLEETDG